MATTPNYSFSVYSSTDTDVRFLDFRVATAGSQSTSNFYVIDTVLKQHSDAIDSINATPSAFVVKGTYSSGSLYTASVANYPGYKNEQLIVLSLNQKNTGAVQININGTTNKDVMKYGSDGVLKAVDAGDFVANSPVLCLYDGTRFVVIGITSASSITVTGEAGDILQIADDGTIESSGKKAAQPNGIATLDENGNVVQVANMANSAAAVYSGEPVTIEYAGAQRIASITAYGETPQGGTTEAPVALTGISSVTVNEDVTELPIPRPLRKVGDVRDVCRTRVKSVYDKRIVLDGTEYWFISKGVFFYKSAVTDNALTMAACDRYKFHITDNGVSGVTTDKTFAFNIATPERIMIRDDDYTSIEEFKAHLTDNPLTVYYQSTAYDGTNGLDVCLTEYQNDFVELDGTEASHLYEGIFSLDYSPAWPTPVSRVNGVCSHYLYRTYFKGKIGLTDNGAAVVYNPNGDYTGDEGGLANWKAYLAAQKAAGTPVQVAYQLAAPEVYATDPVDFDNTAGPLTVVTGGQVEVKMTDFVTDRTPAFLNKLDKTGDGSDVTVTFTEAATDTDIASGDKLSILFGKILKRFSTITSKFTTVDNSITQIESDISDITDGTTVVAQANKVTNALVIMSNSGTALVNYDGSATANMTLSPSNVGAEPAFTKNTAFNKNFGSSAGTVCQGNDGRLSNARRSSNITMSLSGTNLSISYS